MLPVVCRLWASLWVAHLKDWVKGGYLSLCVALVMTFSFVEIWFSAAFDVEEVLSGARDEQLHVLVAVVIKSFDTVDSSILDSALGRLRLPHCFRKVSLAYHFQVRFWFKLAAGLGEPWFRDGGSPQGCPLRMIYIVALYVPWCRRLESSALC